MRDTQHQIYMDYQATTPCDKRVVDKMLPYFTDHFGNPHSRNHVHGWVAEEAVEVARQQVAKIINANPKEIIFTSGATEANNLALKGVAHFYGQDKNHVITCVTEHKCILDSCRHLEQEGFRITYLPVKSNGLIDLDQLEKEITDKTALVSIMAVNNEIGVIQPIHDIGAICRKKGTFFHTDAAQAIGKIPINVEDMNIDLLSLSGHKMYGPKGIGALFVRRKPRVRIKAMIDGGGQERGMRSGTLPTPLCVALGEACVIAKNLIGEENQRLKALHDRFIKILVSELDEIYINGDADQRIPGNINISFAYVEGEALLMALKNLSVSSGSACTSASLEPSYVLRALGVDEELAHTSIRFGLGRYTTQEHVDYAAQQVIKAVKKLRDMSPLYEMAKEGIDLKTVQWGGH